MPRQPKPAPSAQSDATPEPASAAGAPAEEPRRASAPAVPSLAGLGIAGVSRRRIAAVGLAVVAVWIVIGFAGQAAEASRASARLADEQARNAVVAADTAAMHRELQLVTEERWILQQARAYSLGSRNERPFALAPDASPLPEDAPGSLARRVGAEVVQRTPLESWLEVLFGSAGG